MMPRVPVKLFKLQLTGFGDIPPFWDGCKLSAGVLVNRLINRLTDLIGAKSLEKHSLSPRHFLLMQLSGSGFYHH